MILDVIGDKNTNNLVLISNHISLSEQRAGKVPWSKIAQQSDANISIKGIKSQ